MSKKKKKDRKPLRIFAWLDPHHRIEFNAVVMASSVLLVFGAFGYSNYQAGVLQHKESLTTSPFPSTVPFSQSTQTNVTLNNIQTTSDQKTAFVSFNFSSMQQIGIEANNYEFYISDAQHQNMLYPVQGRFYLYPTMQRGVLVLSSSQQIPKESLVLFMMNQKKVPIAEQGGIDNAVQNNSGFGNYDVAQFTINPGAGNVVSTPRINPNLDDLESVYLAVFGSGTVVSVNKAIANDQKTIQQNKSAIPGVIDRLQNEGFTVPNPPAWYDDNWRPSLAVDPATGLTKSGQKMTSEMLQNLTLPDAKLPSTLKSSKGISMGSNTQNSDSPAGQWNNLKNIWNTIGTKKMDMYVTQNYRLYKIKHASSSLNKTSTIGDSSRVKQLGATNK